MEKHNYEPPKTQAVILLQREYFCASSADATFTNEGYGADEETFNW